MVLGLLNTTVCLCTLQENASLKMEVVEKGSRGEEQACKTGELTEQRHVIPNLILFSITLFLICPYPLSILNWSAKDL